MALASVLLGISSLACICFAGIPAVVLGALALSDIARSSGTLRGRRLAITGIATGVCFGFVCAPLTVTLLIPAYQSLRGPKTPEVRLMDPPSRLTLSNGLTVLIEPGGDPEQVAMAVLYPIGGDHDSMGQSGMAHVTAYAYFTAAAGDVPESLIDRVMASNVLIGDRYTIFASLFSNSALDSKLREAASRMSDLRLTPEVLDVAKGHAINELEERFSGTPLVAAHNHARELVRPAPLGGRRGGLPDHIANISLQAVQNRIEQFYRPNNAVLVLAGAVEPASVRAAIEQHFSSLTAGEPPPQPAQPSPPALGVSKQVVAKSSVTDSVLTGQALGIAHPAPEVEDELFPAFLLLAAHLMKSKTKLGGLTGRCQFYCWPVIDSTFRITVRLEEGETRDQVVGQVDRFVADVLTGDLAAVRPPVADELDLFNYGNIPPVSRRVHRVDLHWVPIATGRRFQLSIESADLVARRDAVTNDQLRAAAKAYFAPARHSVVLAVPE